jgi:hypothetical protein
MIALIPISYQDFKTAYTDAKIDRRPPKRVRKVRK